MILDPIASTVINMNKFLKEAVDYNYYPIEYHSKKIIIKILDKKGKLIYYLISVQ